MMSSALQGTVVLSGSHTTSPTYLSSSTFWAPEYWDWMVWQRGRGGETNRRNALTGAATRTICSNVRLTSYSPSVVSHSHSAADAVGWHCSGSHSSYCTNTRSVTYLFSPPTARSEALRYQRTHSRSFSSQIHSTATASSYWHHE